MINILKDFTEDELHTALAAIHDSVLAETLIDENSDLVVFLMDSSYQNALFDWANNFLKKSKKRRENND